VEDGKLNLLGLNRRDMEAFFLGLGEKAFRVTQVMKWIYHRKVTDFDMMTDLSKPLREKLKQIAAIGAPAVAAFQTSQDGSYKWLLRLDSVNCVETVFIPEPGRGTLCVSSQVGCPLSCTFCATGRQGFNRNLGTAEIIGQVWQVHRLLGGRQAITNVVMMGMGEPLLNFDCVVKAMDLMQDDLAYGLSKRRITLSTAGVVPAIYRLREVSDVSLAVSLHAPSDELRDQLVPLNRKYPIAQLLEACKHYISGKAPRRITWEYVMLAGVNDSEANAYALARLLKGIPSKVNLIPFNSFPGSDYCCPDQAVIDRFRGILMAHDLTVITRKTRGGDIAAACGQLAGQVQSRRGHLVRLAGRATCSGSAS
jgi:23S rRNA (adenine2503-C2)-methyltransferase